MKGEDAMSKTYTTILGDTWDLIAFKMLESELYTNLLIKSNLKYVDTVVFSAGVTLVIPEVIEKQSLNLPPWKLQGGN